MPLPDERPRASVANLIGRFEKQTRKSSLATDEMPSVTATNSKPMVPIPKAAPKDALPAGAPSWMKKKDPVVAPPANPPVETTAAVAAEANGAGAAAEKVSSPQTDVEAPFVPFTVRDETVHNDDPFVVTPKEVIAPQPTKPIPKTVTSPEAAVSSPPKPKPSAATSSAIKNSGAKPARSAAGQPPIGVSRPPPSTSTSASKSAALSQSAMKTTSTPKAAVPNRLATSTSAPSGSSLSKSKSTPLLKSRAEAAASKEPQLPSAPVLKPQHTGTSTTSNTRRMVATPVARAKTPSATTKTPVSVTKPRPIGGPSSALYAPTASSLARAKAASAAATGGTTTSGSTTTKKPPPSSFASPKAATPAARPRSGSSGSMGLKPLHLPMKTSVSASGSTRRLVAVPRTRDKSPAPATKTTPVKAAAGAGLAVPAAAVAAAAMTSEEELILSGDITVADDRFKPELVDTAVPAEEERDLVTPVDAKEGSTTDEPSSAVRTPSPVPSPRIEEQTVAKVDVPAEGARTPSVHEDAQSDIGHGPAGGDELENIVSMLEAPPKGAMRYEDEHEHAVDGDDDEEDIPEIPDHIALAQE